MSLIILIVGTSKKRQNSTIKSDKRQAKRQRVEVDPYVACTSCKSVGHKSSRHPDCPNHISSKLEVMNRKLGTGFESFTRKLPFDTCVKENYRDMLKNRIISASDDVRQILFRAQLFVNYYIILNSNETITANVYQQSFWYSICQLVNNRRITNGNGISSELINHWNNFRRQHPSILYDVKWCQSVFNRSMY